MVLPPRISNGKRLERFQGESDISVKPTANLAISTTKARWFVVIGARRTGTNILREILNTNTAIAMLGEVFWPSPAPAHWDNFLSHRTHREHPPADCDDAAALLDEYLEFVEYRIRNHWQGNKKAGSSALGVDIKYDQLRQVTPADGVPTAPPFLLAYVRSHRIVLIHTVRKNVIKCAISEMIAQHRNLWHNYHRTVIDRGYHVDVGDCLGRARRIRRQRAEFERLAQGCVLIESKYEEIAAAVAGASEGRLAENVRPLQDIAKALGVPCQFNYDGRLRRAIDVPYSRVISNHAEVQLAVRDSEFSQFAATLD